MESSGAGEAICVVLIRPQGETLDAEGLGCGQGSFLPLWAILREGLLGRFCLGSVICWQPDISGQHRLLRLGGAGRARWCFQRLAVGAGC